MLAAASADAQPTPPAPAACASAPSASASAAVDALAAAGFEAVGACVDGAVATVTYENRLYAYDLRALDAVVRIASAHLPDVERLRLAPTRNGVPLVQVDAPTADQTGPGGLDSSALDPSLRPPPLPDRTADPTQFTLDLVLHPRVGFGFGDFDDPVRLDLAVAPALQANLWRGMSLTAQVVVPLVEETDALERGVRPGIVAAHQEVRLPFSTFARVSAGLFTRQRYGLDVTTTTFFAGGRAAVTLRAGQTGFAALDGGTWLYSDPDVTTYSVRADAYLLPQYGLGAGVTYGRYLSEEPGVRADLYRSFGNATVGVFALTSEDNPNVGGRLVLPLPVRRHARPGRVRARLANTVELEYRYRRVPGEAPDYDTTVEPWTPLGPLHPSLLPYLSRRYGSE